GKISKEQRAVELDVWMTSLSNPDFAQFVNNCGGLGIRVTDAAHLDAALQQALDYDGPATVEILSDVLLV
ncbi:MAG: thiamine pyrophosphate-dependent enzyme, partial [Acidobacteriota bacterium]